jgi:ethanolaminephosphotransferase
MVYILESHLPNLAKHQFKSTGYSALDNVLSRWIWEPFVSCFPLTLAPNTVTVVGLFFMIGSYVILLPFDSSFAKESPGFALALSGFFQFMYQTLDACDGKQARRLKLASPLGMLMDHGCDSLSCSLILMAVVQGLGLGLTWNVFWLFAVVQAGFFLTHWEEYHTHYHRTQMFNWGVTEGQWTNIIILWITSVLGASTWQQKYFGFTLETILIFGNIGMGTIIAILMILTTLSKVRGFQPILRLLPMILMNISLYLWFEGDLIKKYAPLVMTVHGLVFARVNSRLIICSTSVMKFNWFDLDVIIELAFLLQNKFFPVLPSESAFFSLVALITIRYCSFVYSVVNQLASYLKVSVFKVKLN